MLYKNLPDEKLRKTCSKRFFLSIPQFQLIPHNISNQLIIRFPCQFFRCQSHDGSHSFDVGYAGFFDDGLYYRRNFFFRHLRREVSLYNIGLEALFFGKFRTSGGGIGIGCFMALFDKFLQCLYLYAFGNLAAVFSCND